MSRSQVPQAYQDKYKLFQVVLGTHEREGRGRGKGKERRKREGDRGKGRGRGESWGGEGRGEDGWGVLYASRGFLTSLSPTTPPTPAHLTDEPKRRRKKQARPTRADHRPYCRGRIAEQSPT